MTIGSNSARRVRLPAIAALITGSVFQLGFLDSCNDQLVNLTLAFDPCGTLLTCTPGSFFSNNVEIGSEAANCWDPTCTVPGLCAPGTPPLGTIRDPCN